MSEAGGIRILRWRNLRTSHHASDGSGGTYTIDRWNDTWSIHHVPASWPDNESNPPRRVEWKAGVRHTLAMAKASCQRDMNQRLARY